MDKEGALAFATPEDWSGWLAAHHDRAPELWLKLYRKASGIPSITWEQAVIEALAYGWIDGVKHPGDETHWFQRFTPRRAKSAWSRKNTDHVVRLIAEGRMQPAGMALVTAARADGRWDAAYHGGRTGEMPQDFLDLLVTNPVANATYQTLNAANRYAIYYRLTTAKRPETRARRLDDVMAKLSSGGKFV